MNFFRYFAAVFKLSPVIFVINFITVIFQAVIETLAILALTPLVDYFIKSDDSGLGQITAKFSKIIQFFNGTPSLKLYIIIFIALTLLKAILGLLFRYVSLRTKYLFLKQLMTESFDKFLKGGMEFFNSEKQGVLINTFNSEISTVGNSLSTMSLFLANLARLFFYVMIPFSISWQMSLIAVIIFGIVIVPSKLSDKLSYFGGKKNVSTANNLNIALLESLSAIKVILAFGNRAKASSDYREAFNAHQKVTIPFQMISHILNAVFEPLFVTVLFFILYLSKAYFKIPLSELVVMLYAFKTMIPLVLSMIMDKNYIFGFIASYEQIERLQAKAISMATSNGVVEFQGLKGTISLKNISFRYSNNLILNQLNLTIKKGEKIALVGKSGAGKTTIVDLILGLYQPSNGQVLIDDVDLKSLEIESFRQKIGYVPQDPVLFNRSLRDNLLWAKEGLSDEEIIEVCKLSNSSEFIQNLTEGLNTVMGERGAKLSGGERQRIALSRALIRKPDLLILDEATSALDNQSEKLIQETIDSLGNDTTIILIAHRLSTIKKVDRIFVIDEGRVVESGNYEQLLLRNEFFAKLASQLS